jgi:ubiquinone/menaquinone biosynthesis C-methylase UbiE
MEPIPSPDDRGDLVFCVEASNISANPDQAIAEMVRVARPGGWIVIIVKQRARWGEMDCPPWELWLDRLTMRSFLEASCYRVTADPISYDNDSDSAGLVVVFKGRKRLSPEDAIRWPLRRSRRR